MFFHTNPNDIYEHGRNTVQRDWKMPESQVRENYQSECQAAEAGIKKNLELYICASYC